MNGREVGRCFSRVPALGLPRRQSKRKKVNCVALETTFFSGSPCLSLEPFPVQCTVSWNVGTGNVWRVVGELNVVFVVFVAGTPFWVCFEGQAKGKPPSWRVLYKTSRPAPSISLGCLELVGSCYLFERPLWKSEHESLLCCTVFCADEFNYMSQVVCKTPFVGCVRCFLIGCLRGTPKKKALEMVRGQDP